MAVRAISVELFPRVDSGSSSSVAGREAAVAPTPYIPKEAQMCADQCRESEAVSRLEYGVFGWAVRRSNGVLLLTTGFGVGAVAVSRRLTAQVLAGVADRGCSGPAVSVSTKQGVVTFLLVDTDGLSRDEDFLPEDVRVLTAGTELALPDGERRSGRARWLVPPDVRERWLPSLTAVLSCIRATSHRNPPGSSAYAARGMETGRSL